MFQNKLSKISKTENYKLAMYPSERILAEELEFQRPALREVLKALSLLGINVSAWRCQLYCNWFTAVLLTSSIIYFKCTTAKLDALQLEVHLESKSCFSSPPKIRTPLDAAWTPAYHCQTGGIRMKNLRDLDRDSYLKIAQIANH